MSAFKTLATIGFSALTVSAASLASAPAYAASFGFNNITGGDNFGDGLATGFSMDVTDAGSGNVLFKIFNNTGSGVANFISDVYFDDANPTLLSSPTLNSSFNIGNVSFTQKSPTPGTLPQGNNLTPQFTESFGFGNATGDGNAAGVQTGEALGIQFTGNFTNIINAINAGTLRVGLHVQGIGTDGKSDSFVSGPPSTAIPTPALLPGVIGVGLGLLRKRQQLAKSESH